MDVKRDQDSDITILSVTGRVDSSNAKGFEGKVLPELEGEQIGLIIDFSSLEYISSAGLRVILMAAKTAQKAQLSFAICALNEEITELFSITGFDSIINIEGTREAAISTARAG